MYAAEWPADEQSSWLRTVEVWSDRSYFEATTLHCTDEDSGFACACCPLRLVSVYSSTFNTASLIGDSKKGQGSTSKLRADRYPGSNIPCRRAHDRDAFWFEIDQHLCSYQCPSPSRQTSLLRLGLIRWTICIKSYLALWVHPRQENLICQRCSLNELTASQSVLVMLGVSAPLIAVVCSFRPRAPIGKVLLFSSGMVLDSKDESHDSKSLKSRFGPVAAPSSDVVTPYIGPVCQAWVLWVPTSGPTEIR